MQFKFNRKVMLHQPLLDTRTSLCLTLDTCPMRLAVRRRGSSGDLGTVVCEPFEGGICLNKPLFSQTMVNTVCQKLVETMCVDIAVKCAVDISDIIHCIPCRDDNN